MNDKLPDEVQCRVLGRIVVNSRDGKDRRAGCEDVLGDSLLR